MASKHRFDHIWNVISMSRPSNNWQQFKELNEFDQWVWILPFLLRIDPSICYFKVQLRVFLLTTKLSVGSVAYSQISAAWLRSGWKGCCPWRGAGLKFLRFALRRDQWMHCWWEIQADEVTTLRFVNLNWAQVLCWLAQRAEHRDIFFKLWPYRNRGSENEYFLPK